MIRKLLKFLGINSSDSNITKEPKMKSEEMELDLILLRNDKINL